MCLFRMLVEHPVALARADKNLKKDIPWISVLAVGMFLGSPTDIQRIGPMSEIDIFWTSTGLTCVMWVGGSKIKFERKPKIIYTRLLMAIVFIFGLFRRRQNDKIMMTTVLLLYKKFKILATSVARTTTCKTYFTFSE